MSQDRMLTKLGIAKALVSLAAIAAGIHDKDAALEWCVKQGFIRQGRTRDEIIVTQRGAAVVWLFWKAYKTGRLAHRGKTVDLSEWGIDRGDDTVQIEGAYLHGEDPEPA